MDSSVVEKDRFPGMDSSSVVEKDRLQDIDSPSEAGKGRVSEKVSSSIDSLIEHNKQVRPKKKKNPYIYIFEAIL